MIIFHVYLTRNSLPTYVTHLQYFHQMQDRYWVHCTKIMSASHEMVRVEIAGCHQANDVTAWYSVEWRHGTATSDDMAQRRVTAWHSDEWRHGTATSDDMAHDERRVTATNTGMLKKLVTSSLRVIHAVTLATSLADFLMAQPQSLAASLCVTRVNVFSVDVYIRRGHVPTFE